MPDGAHGVAAAVVALVDAREGFDRELGRTLAEIGERITEVADAATSADGGPSLAPSDATSGGA